MQFVLQPWLLSMHVFGEVGICVHGKHTMLLQWHCACVQVLMCCPC